MDNRAPELILPPGERSWAPVRFGATANTSLSNPPALWGGARLLPGDRVLLPVQSSAPANGLYAAGSTGPEKAPGGSFVVDLQTPTTVTGLTVGQSYVWLRGQFTASLVNGAETLTEDGVFVAAGTSVQLFGLSADDVFDSVKAAVLTRTGDADADAEFVGGKLVDVREGAAAGQWRLDPLAGLPISNSLALTFRPTAGAASAVDPFTAMSNAAPQAIGVSVLVAIMTSLGPLTGSGGETIHGLL